MKQVVAQVEKKNKIVALVLIQTCRIWKSWMTKN